MMESFLDRLGISASLICLVHCLLTPVLIFSMPVAGQYLSHQNFHLIIAVLVFPVAILALWMGYKIHHIKRILFFGGIGLAFIAIAMTAGSAEYFQIETVSMICAGIFLSSAHFLNLRACRSCRVKSAPAP